MQWVDSSDEEDEWADPDMTADEQRGANRLREAEIEEILQQVAELQRQEEEEMDSEDEYYRNPTLCCKYC